MALAQFRGDLTETGLSVALTDLIRAVCGATRYFDMLNGDPPQLAEVLREVARATDMGDERSTDAV